MTTPGFNANSSKINDEYYGWVFREGGATANFRAALNVK